MADLRAHIRLTAEGRTVGRVRVNSLRTAGYIAERDIAGQIREGKLVLLDGSIEE